MQQANAKALVIEDAIHMSLGCKLCYSFAASKASEIAVGHRIIGWSSITVTYRFAGLRRWPHVFLLFCIFLLIFHGRSYVPNLKKHI